MNGTEGVIGFIVTISYAWGGGEIDLGGIRCSGRGTTPLPKKDRILGFFRGTRDGFVIAKKNYYGTVSWVGGAGSCDLFTAGMKLSVLFLTLRDSLPVFLNHILSILSTYFVRFLKIKPTSEGSEFGIRVF